MARNTWDVEVRQSGTTFVSDGTIYRPNDILNVDLNTTANIIVLADGSRAFVTPENKFLRQTIRFIWLEIPNSDSLRTQVENYVINQDYLRITTHLSEQLTGRFTFVRRIWLRGVDDTYDIEAGYDRVE